MNVEKLTVPMVLFKQPTKNSPPVPTQEPANDEDSVLKSILSEQDEVSLDPKANLDSMIRSFLLDKVRNPRLSHFMYLHAMPCGTNFFRFTSRLERMTPNCYRKCKGTKKSYWMSRIRARFCKTSTRGAVRPS
jgi:hypothetical protein